jgi:signal transduction histidine kinase
VAHGAFGHSVDGAGDVNGDGFGDIVVSAFRSGRLAGEVRVHYGGPDGVSASRSWRFEGRVRAGELGHQVAGLGDVNGDGFDDLLVGAPQFFQEPDFNGRLFAFYGGPEGLPEVPSWEYSPDLNGPGNIGFSVGAAGDVNGDGYADAIAGAYVDLSPAKPGRLPSRGRARVFLGGPTGLGPTPIWEAAGDQEQSFFAYAVQGVGDLNGDGYAEVAVGEIQFSAAAPKVGRVLVYYGSPQGPRPMADWSIQGIQAFQEMGVSMHRAGDVNGDGYDDLVLAANRTSNGQNGEGLVLVFHGSPRGLGLTPDWSFESNQVDFLLGHSVAGAGDVNGDGYGDLVVGAFYGEQVQADEGMALVFHGSRRGLAHRPSWSGRGETFRSGYGATVRSAGDLNGDGIGDVIIGQPNFTGDMEYQGRAWVLYGVPGRGLEGGTGWRPPGESYGFQFRTVVLPIPTTLWTPVFMVAMGVLTFLLTHSYHRRKERQAMRLAQEKEATRAVTLREERHRVARDLHDHLGTHFTYIRQSSQRLREAVQLSTSAQAEVVAIQGHADAMVDNLQELIWVAQPTHDTLPSLVGHLMDQATRAFHTTETALRIDAPIEVPDYPIPAPMRRDLSLAFKEALHNIVKHAQPRKVDLLMQWTNHRLKVVLENDGVQSDPSWDPSRNGLRNAQERMRAHGGEAQIQFSPGTVRVTFDLPYPRKLEAGGQR